MSACESESFLPIIDPHRCDGCAVCVQVCPTGVLTMAEGLAMVTRPDQCSYCADCEEHCPQGAISLPYQIVSGLEIGWDLWQKYDERYD